MPLLPESSLSGPAARRRRALLDQAGAVDGHWAGQWAAATACAPTPQPPSMPTPSPTHSDTLVAFFVRLGLF